MQDMSIDPTFGIEIECIYLYNTSQAEGTKAHQGSSGDESPSGYGSDEYDGEDDLTEEEIQGGSPAVRGLKAVHDALLDPVWVQCSTCSELHQWSLPLNPIATYTTHPNYNRWTVKQDTTVKLTSSEKALFCEKLGQIRAYSIEIASRVLFYYGVVRTVARPASSHIHEITAQAEVAAVYGRLQTAFNVFSDSAGHDQRLVINSTCSTHVHVGRGDEGFSVPTAKNIISTVVACEKSFDTLHAVSRIGGSTLALRPRSGSIVDLHQEFLQPEPYNRPWSAHFAEKVHARSSAKDRVDGNRYPESHFDEYSSLRPAALRYDIPSWLEIIRNAPGIDDLAYLQYCAGHSSTVSLGNLEQRNAHKESKKTVEFRQHAGTLQAAEILAWIEVCVRLVEFASSTSEADVAALYAGEWSSPLHNANELLQTIGVSKTSRDHYKKITSLGDHAYSTNVLEQELAVAASWPQELVLSRLVEHLIRGRCDQLRFDCVARRVHDKLTKGCYGRFDADYLVTLTSESNPLVLSKEQQEELTFGYKVPLPDVEPQADGR